MRWYLLYLKSSDNLISSATITVSGVVAAFPASNAGVLPLSKPARCGNSPSTMRWDIDLGSAKQVELLALSGINITKNATVTVKAGGSPVPGTTVGTIPWRRGNDVHVLLPAPLTHRYWAVEIQDATNPYAFTQIGYITIGVPTTLSVGYAGYRVKDIMMGLREESESFAPIRRHVAQGMELAFTFENQLVSEVEDVRDLFLDNYGSVEPAYFVPHRASLDGLFGRIQQDEFERTYATGTIVGNAELVLVKDPISPISLAV